MAEQMVKVKILSLGRIPFIGGNGPINNPIMLPMDQYDTLVKLGFKVERILEVIDPIAVIPPNIKRNEDNQLKNENLNPFQESSDGVNNINTEDGIIINSDSGTSGIVDSGTDAIVNSEEDIADVDNGTDAIVNSEEDIADVDTDEDTIEILMNDEKLSAEAYYTIEFLTKKKAIAILEARKVIFDINLNAEPLKQLVINTNPEVELEE